MDLNYLYHRRGVSLLRAAGAACLASGKAHQALAAAYGARIDEHLVAVPTSASGVGPALRAVMVVNRRVAAR